MITKQRFSIGGVLDWMGLKSYLIIATTCSSLKGKMSLDFALFF